MVKHHFVRHGAGGGPRALGGILASIYTMSRYLVTATKIYRFTYTFPAEVIIITAATQRQSLRSGRRLCRKFAAISEGGQALRLRTLLKSLKCYAPHAAASWPQLSHVLPDSGATFIALGPATSATRRARGRA